jgi:hypothetical protein
MKRTAISLETLVESLDKVLLTPSDPMTGQAGIAEFLNDEKKHNHNQPNTDQVSAEPQKQPESEPQGAEQAGRKQRPKSD